MSTPAECSEWFNRVARCTTSSAVALNAAELTLPEVAMVAGSLLLALSDTSGMPVESIAENVLARAREMQSARPEKPAESVGFVAKLPVHLVETLPVEGLQQEGPVS